MPTNYPDSIDTNAELPLAIDNVTQVNAASVNNIRGAVLAIERELGIDPSREFGTVRARLDSLDGRISTLEGLGIGGGSGLEIRSNGVSVLELATVLDFLGADVTVSAPGVAEILITGGVGGGNPEQESVSVSNGQTAFTLSISPLEPDTVMMFINGMKQEYGDDYTVVDTAVTWNNAFSLLTTDTVEFWYLVDGSGSGGGGESLADTLSIGNSTGGTDIVFSSGSDVVLSSTSQITSQGSLVEINDSAKVFGDLTVTGIGDEFNGIRFDEQGSVPSAVPAGKGLIWVRSSDSKLIFTDDSSTNFTLNETPAWSATLAVSADSGATSPRIASTAALQFQQRAASPGALPLHGQVWVKNTSPTTLYFTDNVGTDFDLTATGGGSLTPPVNPDDDLKLAYGFDGDLSYADQVKTDGTYLGLGTSPAATGTIRFSSGDTIISNDSGTDRTILSQAGNIAILGSSTAVAKLVAPTAESIIGTIGVTDVFTFSETLITLGSPSLVFNKDLTNPLIEQSDRTTSGSGQDFTIHAQDADTSGVGGSLNLIAGLGFGTSNGGDITLTPGTASGSGEDGYVLLNGTFNTNNYKIINVPLPEFADDAVNKAYVDQFGAGASFSLSATLAIGNTTDGYDIIISTNDRLVGEDGYIDVDGYFDMLGAARIVSLLDPVNPQDAATKAYVDSIITGDSIPDPPDDGDGYVLTSNSAVLSWELNVESSLTAPLNPDDDDKVAYALGGDLAYLDSGTAGMVLLESGGGLTWGQLDLSNAADSFFGTLPIAHGGTELTALGAANTVLQVNSGGSALEYATINNANVDASAAIDFTKLATIATDSLLGRDTAGTGALETISLNATLSMTGSGALQRAALTGDITASAGSNTTAIASGVIVNADVNASAAIAFSKLATITTDSLLGRDTAGTGALETITLDDTLEMTGSQVLQRAALSGDITATAGSNTTAITADVIVNADVNTAAAIAGTKISPDFGSQNITTTGDLLLGTTPATAGDIRVNQGFTLQGRNNANNADRVLFSWGSTDRLTIGANTQELRLHANSTGISFSSNSTDVGVFDTTQILFDTTSTGSARGLISRQSSNDELPARMVGQKNRSGGAVEVDDVIFDIVAAAHSGVSYTDRGKISFINIDSDGYRTAAIETSLHDGESLVAVSNTRKTRIMTDGTPTTVFSFTMPDSTNAYFHILVEVFDKFNEDDRAVRSWHAFCTNVSGINIVSQTDIIPYTEIGSLSEPWSIDGLDDGSDTFYIEVEAGGETHVPVVIVTTVTYSTTVYNGL